jgi:hypothetical protein
MTTSVAGVGDTLVIKKADGRCNVKVKNITGQWEFLRGGSAPDVSDGDNAYKIAVMKMQDTHGRAVWFHLDSESESAIRPYHRSDS